MVKIEQRGSKFFARRIGGKRRRAVINKNPYRGIDRLWARLAAPKFAKYSVELLEKMKNRISHPHTSKKKFFKS